MKDSNKKSKQVEIICKETSEVVNSYANYRKTKHWFNLKESYYLFNEYVCEMCSREREIDLYHKVNKPNEQNEKLGQEDLEDLISLCSECNGNIQWYKRYYLFNRATDKQIELVNNLLQEHYIPIVEILFPDEISNFYTLENIKIFDREKLMCYEVQYLVNEIKHIHVMFYWYYAAKMDIKLMFNPGPTLGDESRKEYFFKRVTRFNKYILTPKREVIETVVNKYNT